MGTPWVKNDDQWSHFSIATLGLGSGFVNEILEDGAGCLRFAGEDGLNNNCEIPVPPVEESDVPMDEESLSMFWFDGVQWVEEPTCVVDMDHNRIIATPDHMTIFALLGEAEHVYLPAVTRD